MLSEKDQQRDDLILAIETGTRRLVNLLIGRWGVRHRFGDPRDGINGAREALRRRRDIVQLVQVRHEAAAAFATTGYAKFTRRHGARLATSGWGASHLLNGLCDAKVDQAPVLAITSVEYLNVIGTRGYAPAQAQQMAVGPLDEEDIRQAAPLACADGFVFMAAIRLAAPCLVPIMHPTPAVKK